MDPTEQDRLVAAAVRRLHMPGTPTDITTHVRGARLTARQVVASLSRLVHLGLVDELEQDGLNVYWPEGRPVPQPGTGTRPLPAHWG